MRKTRAAALLGKFLESRNVSEWAVTHGFNDTYLNHLCAGDRIPSIPFAIRLEKATLKAVPLRAWGEK